MPAPAHPRLAARLAMEGIPRYVVAARLGINGNTLGGIISGRLEPTGSQRERIAELLGVPADELFEDGDS